MSEGFADTVPEPWMERAVTAAVAVVCFLRLLWSGSIHADAGFLNNALLALLLAAAVWKRPRNGPGRLLAAGAALYFGAAFISIPFSVAPWLALRSFLFRLGGLFLLLLVIRSGTGRMMGAALTAAVALSAAYALRQRLGGFEATIASGLASEYALETLREGRVFGLTFSPDMLAAMLAGTLPVLISFIASGLSGDGGRAGRPAAMVSIVLLPLILSVLVLTRSVGGFLAAGAGMGAWAFLHLPRRAGAHSDRRVALAAGIGLVLVVAGAVGIAALRGGHLFEFGSPYNPLVRRLDNWVTALKVWREFPLLGCGEGQAGLAMFLHRSLAGNEAKHAHNALIEALAETGPLGLTGLALIFAGFIINALKLRQSDAGSGWWTRAVDADQEMRMGLAAGAAAVALHAMMDFDFAAMEVAAVFWIGCAASQSGAGRRGPAGAAGRRRRALMTCVLIVTALAELYQARGAELRGQAQAAAQAGQWSEAGDRAHRALAWDPTADGMYSTLGRSAMYAPAPGASPQSAIAALRHASSLSPRNPFYYRDLGMALLGRDPTAAGKMFEKAVALYPNSMDFNIRLGQWLAMQGRSADARRVLQHAVQCQAFNADALFELGRLDLSMGREREGMEEMELSTRTPPVSGSRAAAYARELEAVRGREAALDFLTQWCSEHPDDPAADSALKALQAHGAGH